MGTFRFFAHTLIVIMFISATSLFAGADAVSFHTLKEKPKMKPNSKKDMIVYISKNYPKIARKTKKSGRAIVKFVCDKSGNVTEAKVLQEKPKNFGFGDVAIEAVKKLQFTPGKKQGELVNVNMTQMVRFRIK